MQPRSCLAALFLILALPAAAAAQTPLFRVNAGGPETAATDGGPAWSADTQAAPSAYVNAAATGNAVGVADAPLQPADASVPAYAPSAIFTTERYDGVGGEEMTWSFPVSAGAYEVILYFAETYAGTQAVGQRVFDVEIEGETVLSGLDAYARYGGYTPGAESWVVTVDDGALTVRLLHDIQNPAVKGVEVRTADPNGRLAPSTRYLDFGLVEENSVSAPRTVKLWNLGGPGDDTVTLTAVTPSVHFQTDLAAGLSLAPGETLGFQVEFAPTATGTLTGSLEIAHDGANSPVTLDLAGEAFAEGSIPVNFTSSYIQGPAVARPTAIQFGPDGRLYIAEMFGGIQIWTVERLAANVYDMTASETISSVSQILNHDDDGTEAPDVAGRLVTGMYVGGTAAQPVIWVSSSDPRIAVGEDTNLDTNSGTVTRLTWNGSGWDHLDLVVGLPRSEENHVSNGIAVDEENGILYLAQGGHTNMGAPSNSFAYLPEYALSGAILEIDLNAIGDATYVLPTLDDPSRADDGLGGDVGDPYGGNDGQNQAMLVQGGPVQVYSPGYRNPFDVIRTGDGRIYTVDNGPNLGWGGVPVDCSNQTNESNSNTYPDNLHYVSHRGYYGGHPNPMRGSLANTVNGQSPVYQEDPRQCEYLAPGISDSSLAQWPFSTNGLTEYTASNFGGSLRGDILLAGWEGTIQRVELNAAGDSATAVNTFFSNVGYQPLDVHAVGDGGPFPGTIWVALYGENTIKIFEPADYDGGQVGVCTGADDPALDEDGDGYSNHDEILNGTDPCSGGDVPADFDGDLVSNLLDDDDDGDGILDPDDAFAWDPLNGQATGLPVSYTWQEGTPGFGFFSLGFTGFMANGVDDYLDLYDPPNLTAGGAAGKLTIDAVPAGTAYGATNTQEYGFQLGVDVSTATGPFQVVTQVDPPFFGDGVPEPGQEVGFYLGTGGQDDYLSLSLVDGGLRVVLESGGVVVADSTHAASYLTAGSVQLYLAVDPLLRRVQPRWAVDGQAPQDLGSFLTLPSDSPLAETLGPGRALAVGVLATSAGATPFNCTWDRIEVLPDPDALTDAAAELVVTPGAGLDGATEDAGAFDLRNLSGSGQRITQVVVDLSTALLPDLVFDPTGAAGDDGFACVTPDSGAAATGLDEGDLCAGPFSVPQDGGFRVLTLDFADFDAAEGLLFSVDVDPTSIRGSAFPGPDGAGRVGGLELVGATVTVSFDDGSVRLGQLAALPGGGGGARVLLDGGLRPRPGLQRVGSSQRQVSVVDPDQLFRVTAPAGTTVRLLDLEAALRLDGAGFDIDPYEANQAVAVAETLAVVEGAGSVLLPLSLARSDSSAGLHHLVAVAQDGSGGTGLLSEPLVVEVLEPVDSDASALFAIDPGPEITASTFYPGSLALTNTSPSGQRILRVEIDLGGSILPDMVFDPVGTAGDVEGKCLTDDGGGSQVGLLLPSDPCVTPFLQARDGGYEVLVIEFDDFDPGETFLFSTDIDPTSIQGATGVGGPGGVSGLELVGATATVDFDDGARAVAPTWRIPASDGGSQAFVRQGLPAAPQIQILGVDTVPSVVGVDSQTVRVTAPVDSTVSVLVVEGQLVVGGSFGPGYDLDPYEANTALAVREYQAVVGAQGYVDVPILLSDNGGGLNHIRATVLDGAGEHGDLSPTLVLEYDAAFAPQPQLVVAPTGLDFASVDVGDTSRLQVVLRHDGVGADTDITVTEAQLLGFAGSDFSTDFPGSTVLSVGDSLVVEVAFAPLFNGTKDATLRFSHSGANDPVDVALAGEGAGGGSATVLYRVNAGGEALPGWLGDTDASPSPFRNGAGLVGSSALGVDLSDPSLPPGTPAELFATERYDRDPAPQMIWSFPVEPGAYELRLYFADMYSGTWSDGARVFSVDVEDSTVLQDFDIHAAVGPATAVARSFVVQSDSLLQVVFRNGVQNPLINGLEVSRIETTAPDLAAAADSIAVSCSGQATACVEASYTVQAAAGDTLSAVSVSFLYRESPQDAGTVVHSAVDSLVTAGSYAHSFCFDLGPSSAGEIEMVLDGADAVVESAEDNNAATVALDCLGVSTPAARSGWSLSRAVPNPFNPRTRISFSVAEPGRVSLRIYDVAGRLVRVLVDEEMQPGPHSVLWNGEDRTGSRVSSGVYYYRLESSSFSATEKMTLIR